MAQRSSDIDVKDLVERQMDFNEAMNDPKKFLRRKEASLEKIAMPLVEAKGNIQKDVAWMQTEPERAKVDYLTSQTAHDREMASKRVQGEPEMAKLEAQKDLARRMYPQLYKEDKKSGIMSFSADDTGPVGPRRTGMSPEDLNAAVSKISGHSFTSTESRMSPRDIFKQDLEDTLAGRQKKKDEEIPAFPTQLNYFQ
jgi:hypothetical protein